MKTLKQWYDSLSVPAQEWVVENCSTWFDKDQVDYYRKAETVKDNASLTSFLLDATDIDKYSDYSNARVIAHKYLILLRYLHNTQPELISENTLNSCIYRVLESGMHTKNDWLYLQGDVRQFAFRKCFARYNKMKLADALYLVKDYDNLDLNWEEIDIPKLIPEVVEIIGIEEAKKIAKEGGEYAVSRIVNYGKESELFDELFFCKDSWLTQFDKMRILDRIYANSNSLPNLQTIEDFFKRIVAVDHSYLRYIYMIIKRYPAIATQLYQQKKPEAELTGNESTVEQYRYSKEIRKLFVIAHMCVLKRVSKVKSSIAKEVAPLLKIYGYKWDDVYDALYPEDSHLLN